MNKKWDFLQKSKFWIKLISLAIAVVGGSAIYLHYTKNEVITTNKPQMIIGEQVIQTGPGVGKTCIASQPGSVGCSTVVEVK